jgi:murein DD-endopeptidase MepM/ murein hydrolase activator NlpD
VIASEATPAALARDSYSATTPEEIQTKKDEDAAKAAAAARIAAASTASADASVYSGSLAETIARPAPSCVPCRSSTTSVSRTRATRAPTTWSTATPIYAIADGVVVESSENGPGWGVYVKIAHNIGGNTVTSLYAHMSYGSRRVVVGDTVRAGQIIGQVVTRAARSAPTCTSRSTSTDRGPTPRTSSSPTSTDAVCSTRGIRSPLIAPAARVH